MGGGVSGRLEVMEGKLSIRTNVIETVNIPQNIDSPKGYEFEHCCRLWERTVLFDQQS